ncbi:MAG TPA: PadR family transcriptional regulator [Candidatus Dormibacteraeota bacterium]
MAGSLVAQLKKGSTAALLLGLLREREMYGYEIAAQLRERGGDSLSLSEGSLYPALHRLEAGGLVKARWQPAGPNRTRRYYSLTAKGRRQADTSVAELQSFARLMIRVTSGAPG